MSPKTLTILQNLPIIPQKFHNPISIPHFSFNTHFSKSTITFCKSSTITQHLPGPETGPEGVGPSAPSRGDIFMEHHASKTAVLDNNVDIKKKRRKNDGFIKVVNSSPVCYGCGAPLHTNEVDSPGFVDPDTYKLKKKHHQLKTVLCGRCKLLAHGHMITAVGGHGGYSGGKQFVTAEQLREKLSHLRHEKALIVKLVDIVDFNGSFLSRVRDLAGANPIILVITKIDLLPKGTDMNCVGDWVVEATTKKKLNVISVHLTSSKSLVGVTGVVAEIQNEKKGRDVYILGAANVGKSAFINALLKLMANKDPVAAAAQKYKPIQSAVPGTTLGPIQIDAFFSGGKLYDTPGVHLHHRQAAVVHTDDLPALAPQSRLRGRSFPGSSQSSTEVVLGPRGLEDFTIFWGGLVRVDVLKVLPSTRLTFCGPKALQLHVVPTEKADEFYKKEIGVLLTPPMGKQRAESWSGLETYRMLQFSFDEVEGPLCDIAISGLGWITVEPICKELVKTTSPILEPCIDELQFKVHVPKPVEVFTRSPLPIGKAGSEWYQYREISELEEETRPKWHY